MINKFLLSTVLISSLLFSSCSVGNYLTEETKTKEERAFLIINSIRDSAYTEVDYFDMKDYYEDYEGEYFEFDGYIIDENERQFLFYADPYFGENYGFYNILIDHPLPKQSEAGKPLRYLAVGDKVILLGKMIGVQSYSLEKKTIQVAIQNYFLSLSGDEFQNIPTLNAIFVYKDDDYSQQKYPEWTSYEFKKSYGLSE